MSFSYPLYAPLHSSSLSLGRLLPRLPALSSSLSSCVSLLFAAHPYVDISLSIDQRGGIPPVALYGLLLYLSFLSIRSFLYTSPNPRLSSPPPLPATPLLLFSPLSVRSLRLPLAYSFPFDVGYIKAFYTVFRPGLGLEWYTQEPAL